VTGRRRRAARGRSPAGGRAVVVAHPCRRRAHADDRHRVHRYERLGLGEADPLDDPLHADVPEAGVHEDSREHGGVTEPEARVRDRAHLALADGIQIPEERRLGEPDPRGDREAAGGHEHATTLARRGRPVLEEVEALLAEDGIEPLVCGNGQRRRVALPPVDRRRDRAGDREHRRAHVDADDAPPRADAVGRDPRHDSRAAGDVEHALAAATPARSSSSSTQGRKSGPTMKRSYMPGKLAWFMA
jgi:hypothetical protein